MVCAVPASPSVPTLRHAMNSAQCLMFTTSVFISFTFFLSFDACAVILTVIIIIISLALISSIANRHDRTAVFLPFCILF